MIFSPFPRISYSQTTDTCSIMSRPLPIIHINGFPGTGKLTIAKELQILLGAHGKLVHNHLLINPADAVLHRTQPGYQDLRRALREAVFSALADAPATHGTAYIFTDFQSSDPVGSATSAEYAAAARRRGCALIPIVLRCSEEANLERLQTGDRALSGKITDVELLRKFRAGVHIHRFEGMPEMMELDVTNLEPAEAAKIIFDHVLQYSAEVKAVLEQECT